MPHHYLLDADVFITAARNYYAFDLVPSFWDNLTRLADDHQIASIDRIREQLVAGNDRLAEWITQGNLSHSFLSTDDADVIAAYRDIVNWALNNHQFMDAAKARFADNDPDGWLVAYAKAKDYIVTTNETLDPQVKKKIPIPNICRQFGVQSVNTFDMLRALAVRIG
ncbi:MAG: DUF4411 family protein [bacterium]